MTFRIHLYQQPGTAEQFHRKFKTDRDLERPPPGKFETKVLGVAQEILVYNILRYIGQHKLICAGVPFRKALYRFRYANSCQRRFQMSLFHRFEMSGFQRFQLGWPGGAGTPLRAHADTLKFAGTLSNSIDIEGG